MNGQMEKEKQIEEIDNLTTIIWEANHKRSVLNYRWLATEVYNAGYRKESEVASTIIKFLINKKHELQKDKDLINASVEFYDFIDNFIGLTGEEILAEIEKKYIGE